jgi:hypothetical protein
MVPSEAIGGLVRCFGDDDGMTLGGAEPSVEAYVLAMSHQPIRAGLHVRPMGCLGRDTREPNIFAEFVDEPRLVLFKVCFDSVHGGRGIWMMDDE